MSYVSDMFYEDDSNRKMLRQFNLTISNFGSAILDLNAACNSLPNFSKIWHSAAERVIDDLTNSPVPIFAGANFHG